MSTEREIWIAAGETPELQAGDKATLFLRGKPKIQFLRGAPIHSPYEEGLEGSIPPEFPSPVAVPVRKAVIALWKKAKRAPEPTAIVNIAVEADVIAGGKIKIEVGGKPTEIEMEQGDEGWVAKKPLLFVYGEGDADAAAFPDLTLIDITKAGDAGFETEAEVKAGKESRKLGFVDFLIKDPESGKFASCRYGVFKTRTPTVKLVCPNVGANNLQILFDDGQDSTPDVVDVTKLLDPAGDVTDMADMPLAVSLDDPKVKWEGDPAAERNRFYDTAPEEGKTLGLFLLGENRIRVIEKHTGAVIFSGHFLLYEADDQVVVGTWYGKDKGVTPDGDVDIVADHILIDFKEKAPTAGMSDVLWAWHLVPQGFTPEFRILQASPHAHIPANTLAAYVKRLSDSKMPEVEEANLDCLMQGPEAVLERFPESFRRDFVAATSSFSANMDFQYHHFYIHTFPAHRLIDFVRFGATPTPSVILEGSHFLNKTFILPSAKASLNALFQARNDNPALKVCIFGHADASGSDPHNVQLSRFRAEIAHALLVKDPDPWLRRLDGSPLVVESPWGTREIQYMLKELGHYDGPINGVTDEPTKAASRRFLSAKGLPDNAQGRLDRAARRRLIQDYMDRLVPTALRPVDFFQDAAAAPALYAAGESHPLIPSDPNNAQNRRVTFILRRVSPVPVIDLTQTGAAAPFPAWIAPEPDAPALGADNPPFIVGCWDSGFGRFDNFTDSLDAPNRLLIRGRRLVKPTLISASGVTNHRIFRDGDLSGSIVANGTGAVLRMTDIGSPHGTMVMTSMAADGVGSDIGGAVRNMTATVLGTGKDVKFRPVGFASGIEGDFQGALLRYRVLAADPDVKVVSTSIDVRHFNDTRPNNIALFFANNYLSGAQKNALKAAVRAMCKSAASNKLYFLAAANAHHHSVAAPANIARRDVFRTEGGAIAPRRGQKRSSLTGNDEYRRNVVCVGASSQCLSGGALAGDKLFGNHTRNLTEFPSSFTFLGEEVSVAMPGENIRVANSVLDTPPFMGGAPVDTNPGVANKIHVNCVDGTSFSTPMTAGVAAELMLANPLLQQPANMARVVEMIEATADPLPDLALAPANRQGVYIPSDATNPDTQLTAADLRGFRRVHFWKAVLAALNDGLPTEQRIPNPSGAAGTIVATTHFDQLTARDHAATTWYGFEVRAPANGCGIFLRRPDGSFLRIEDAQAALPQGRRIAETWLRTQDYKVAAGPLAGFVLPNFPFAAAPWFLCQFSMKREELARYANLAVFPPGIDPSAPDSARVPAFSMLALGSITRMRAPAAITAAEKTANRDLARIAAHIQEFDDFVFHWTIAPQAHHAFVLVHREGAAVAEDIEVRLFAVDALGLVVTSFAGNVNIGHNGTAGSTAAGVNHGIFINGAAAAAATAVAVAGGMATFQVRNHDVANFRLTASGGGKNDDGTSPVINVQRPGPLAKIRVEVTHHDGRDVQQNPPRVGDRLKYIVSALDSQDVVKTDFRGQIELKVIEGRMGSDGPKRGVHVSDAAADAFSAARFKHTYVAGDRGRFEFSVFNFSTGPVELQAVHESVSQSAPQLNIKAGAIHHFDFTNPANQQIGNAITMEIRARDEFNNLVDDFSGRVVLSVPTAGMAGAVAAGVKSGVHIGNATGNFNLDYRDADLGVKSVPITGYTNGNYQITATSGAINSTSAAITVNAAAALANFGFEAGTNQANGVRFPVTVIAQDAGNNRIPGFLGAVALTRISGPAINPGAPSHTYVAGDNGRFTYDIQPTGAGTLILQAASGAISTRLTVTVR